MSSGIVKPVPIEQELRDSYLDYAMSVIVSRALPDVRDGLKPVQRRILYTMHQLGLRPNAPYKKSARVVGEVLGKYHPHGDAPVYEALVRLAQDFTMRYPLVDGQGNFGSIDNDPPAAMRYTEVRLTPISLEMLADLDRGTVDFAPNFDATASEPVVLPSKLPNLLINGSTGIAVGMSTNIPPHNLSEVCDAICLLIDDPDASLDRIMACLKGPDFPTGGVILGTEGIRTAYETGQGRLILQAVAHVESVRARQRILITQLPYQTNKAALVEKIAQLSKDRKIEGIAEVRDESDRHGIRIVIELKREADPQIVLNQLYKMTSLRSSFYINLLALVDGEPRSLNIKDLLRLHIDFRYKVIIKRTEFDLAQARERAHILEGFKIALDNLDEVLFIIRHSDSAEAARNRLEERFGLSEAQSRALLEMPLRRLAALERRRILEEYEEVKRNISYYEDLLAHPEKIYQLIKEEALEIKRKYGDPRRTQIGQEVADFKEEELIPEQPILVAISERYIKRLSPESFRQGRGLAVQAELLVPANTHDNLIFVTDTGRIFRVMGYSLPAESARTARGTPIVNYFPLGSDEKVVCILPLGRDFRGSFLVMVTARGKIKKLPVAELGTMRRQGLKLIDLDREDRIAAAIFARESDNLLVVTAKGKGIKLALSRLRSRKRKSGGVGGVILERGDRVVSVDIARPGGFLLAVTEQGYGKLTPEENFPVQSPRGKGRRVAGVSTTTGPIACARVVTQGQRVLVLTSGGSTLYLKVSDIPIREREARGKILFNLKQGDKVLSITPLE